MSLNRFNPRRDENEPEIRKRFVAHGWHTEQVSGKGMPDLLVWPGYLALGSGRRIESGHVVLMVDVKMPKGKLKPAQEKKWTELSERGIPVYVVRTEAEVDALVRGELEPWAPATRDATLQRALGVKRMRSSATADRENGAAYTPPSSRPMDAAREAEETFAPGPSAQCACRLGVLCGLHGRRT